MHQRSLKTHKKNCKMDKMRNLIKQWKKNYKNIFLTANSSYEMDFAWVQKGLACVG